MIPHYAPADRMSYGERDLRSAMECLSYLTAAYFGSKVICANPGRSCTRIADTIRFLKRNFEREERMMEVVDYPEAVRHRREHRTLLRKLARLQRILVCSGYDNAMLFELISDWQRDHVPDFDEPLGRRLREFELNSAGTEGAAARADVEISPSVGS